MVFATVFAFVWLVALKGETWLTASGVIWLLRALWLIGAFMGYDPSLPWKFPGIANLVYVLIMSVLYGGLSYLTVLLAELVVLLFRMLGFEHEVS